jgi:hypothetical protein
MRIIKLSVFCLCLINVGCASLSREECLYGDWFNVGLKDGRNGEDASRMIRHQDACTKYGVSPDKAQYLAGREQGLQEYCRLDNAIALGLRGERYQSVCPTAQDRNFRYYNEVAYQVYQSRESLKSLDDSLLTKERALQDKKLTDKARQNLRDEIRDLDRQRQSLRNDLYSAERQLDRLMEELNRFNH